MEDAVGETWRDVFLAPNAMGTLHPDDPASNAMTEDEGDYCRICRGEGTDAQPLFYPCKCSGSIKFVHQDCLMEWLSHSQKKYCELCKTPFRFTKLYDQSMPSTLPLPLFLQQIAIHSLRAISQWTRFIVVGLVWLCWLPWSIRQVWRGLFWLADGSWISENELRDAAMTRVAQVAMLEADETIDAGGAISESMSATLRDTFLKSLPQTVSPISGFLGLSSGEFLLLKIVRLMYPNLFRWSLSLVSGNTSDDGLLRVHSERQPSLLSDVKYLRSLTGLPILDNALVDIFEGQLICLVIITAFILVFLIREWVINQQPILNMPDPDRAEEVAVPVQVQEEAVLPAQRRRRGLRRPLDQPDQEENDAVRDAPRPRAIQIPHLAATEDNMIRPAQIERAESIATLPAGSTSSAPADQSTSPEDFLQTPITENRSADTESTAEVRPSLLPRGAFDDAANIRRIIEEGAKEKHSRVLAVHTPQDSSRQSGNPRIEVSLDLTENSDLVNVEHARNLTHQSDDELSEILDFTEFESAVETKKIFEAPSVNANAGESDGVDDVSLLQTDSSDVIELPTPISTDSSSLAGTANAITGDQRVENIHQRDMAATDDESDRPSMFEEVLIWFWQTDGYVPTVPEIQFADDEHIVEDINNEDPFVPVENPETNARENPEPEQAPFIIPPEPNVQFGIDLNNPDAIDDAEDLDGILELIGVHGPIAGMVQNVIFSEFLITLTIAASVWLPYIWGKITLLILANPVGVFFKAPLYLASKSADTAVDILIFVAGLLGYALSSCAYAIHLLLKPLIPALNAILGASHLQSLSWQLAKSSGNRLEKALSLTALGLKPDLPSFSMQSHHALVVFKQWTSRLLLYTSSLGALAQVPTAEYLLRCLEPGKMDFYKISQQVITLPQVAVVMFSSLRDTLQELASDLKPVSFPDLGNFDVAVAKWSTQDKAIAIFLGYVFFALIGMTYLKIARIVLGLKPEEKVEGVVADSLRQAGGVMKVVIIIGIEMIAFPLYCGLLLDIALMPLFQGVNLRSRILFMLRAPITGLFVHWFIGTCYMFHFALFVSMCRKIMRKGVLYFIRDPDDPTFHPVRDVLERPVATQLGKIAFSALIYGGLVILCLGGVVWSLSGITSVLPIHWAANEPRLAFPWDVIFYNFLLPFLVRKAEPSKKISIMYEWWFRGCASALRLTHFLFGEEREEEKCSHIRRTWAALFRRKQGDTNQPIIGEDRRILAEDREVDTYFYRDGTYVRAPANDTVRIPKGGRVFLEVTENNERLDSRPDQDKGMHGKTDERFTKVYIPPQFRARIATFILLLWIFAASTGVAFTVGPLLVGRKTIRLISGNNVPPNDLYALTLGMHVCGGALYAISYWQMVKKWLRDHAGLCLRNMRHALPQLYLMSRYTLGLLYLALTFGVVLPFALSLLTEIYLHVPLQSYLSNLRYKNSSLNTAIEVAQEARPLPITIYLLQTWTLGLLYLRLALRTAMNYPSPHTRAAIAIRAIVREGWTKPDVKLATRAIVLPISVLCALLLLVPLVLARLVVSMLQISDTTTRASFYRFAYPGLLAVVLTVQTSILLKRQIQSWRIKIRDEVYLIGERLHNFQDVKRSQPRLKSKGKQRAVGERVEVVR